MGYVTHADGFISIEPPLTWGQIKESPFLPEGYGFGNEDCDIALVITEVSVETDEGILVVRTAPKVQQRHAEEPRNNSIEAHLQALVDAFPGHEFTGRFNMEGEDSGDLWRVKVIGRKVRRFDPTFVWPEESEL